MGCSQARIDNGAPDQPETWGPEMKKDGPLFWMKKDDMAAIRFSKEGPGSSDEKQGCPPITIPELFAKAVKRHGDKCALRVERIDGKPPPMDAKTKTAAEALPADKWVSWTYNEFYQSSSDVAKSLMSLGVEQFGTVAIWGFNAPEWVISLIGASMAGAKGAGIYPTDTPEQVRFKCKHADADVVVLEDLKKYEALKSICEDLPVLKAIVIYGDKAPEAKIERKSGDAVQVFDWATFEALGKEKVKDEDLKERIAKIKPGHCTALIYTSGTTGRPKAVMISHDNLIFESKTVNMQVPMFGATATCEKLISYLPLSHIAGMLIDVAMPMWMTGTSAAWVEMSFARPYDLKIGSLKDRLVAVKPTLFLGVPRVWEKIAEKLKAVAANLSDFKKKMGGWAKGKGLEHAKNCQVGGNGKYPPFYGLANKLILSKIKERLGLDQVKFGITGAAPIGKHTLEYWGSLGIDICEVYGMSETTGAATVSTNSCHLWGSCGYRLPGTEVKVFNVSAEDFNEKKECPKAKNIFNPSEEEQGEICFRGRNVMMGYMANESFGEEHVKEMAEKNAKTIDNDGWLHSGDKGCMGTNGMFRITGRYKELIIGAGGENVAPVPIETNVKKLCPILSNVMMYGDHKKFNVCLVTLKAKGATGQEPGTDELDGAAANLKPSVKTISAAMHDKTFIDTITKAITATNKDPLCCPSNAAKIQKFSILPIDFSVETGELTSTLKLKRSVAAKKYVDIIEKIYESKDVYVPFDEKKVATEPEDAKTEKPDTAEIEEPEEETEKPAEEPEKPEAKKDEGEAGEMSEPAPEATSAPTAEGDPAAAEPDAAADEPSATD